MTKREVRKAAYRLIIKEGKSHQEAYDELRTSNTVEIELLASEISKVPSKFRQSKLQSMIYIYLGLLVVVIGLKIIGALAFFIGGELNLTLVLVAVLLGVVIPIYGIYGALTSRIESYTTVGLVLVYNIYRSLSAKNFSVEPEFLIAFIPIVAALILAFYLPTRLKTPYSKTSIKTEVDEKIKSTYKITFEKDPSLSDDLLDTDLNV